jgi:hypothetical protein
MSKEMARFLLLKESELLAFLNAQLVIFASFSRRSRRPGIKKRRSRSINITVNKLPQPTISVEPQTALLPNPDYLTKKLTTIVTKSYERLKCNS